MLIFRFELANVLSCTAHNFRILKNQLLFLYIVQKTDYYIDALWEKGGIDTEIKEAIK